MTTSQTIDGVPRELLEGLLTLAAMSASAPYRELRALLDAPVYPQVKMVKPHKHTCACVTGDSWVCDCGAVVDGLPVPAAQPQGEPVERQPDAIIEGVMTSVGISHAIYASTVTLKHGEQVKLYAEQPAPVAVVMPERRELPTSGPAFYARGWNACLDELKRLNTARPGHANPPPGTEPCGTHPHNDGLDEWRKPQDDQARRAELLESLAQQIYDSWQTQPGWVPWHRAGPSQKKIEARAMASRVFELALANQVGD